MPPFTATSWTTALKRAASTARQAVVENIKPRLTQRAINLVQNHAIQSARQAIHETFPSLSSPTFALRQPPRFALQTIPLNPMQRASMTVRAQGFRLSRQSPRGASMVSECGLGSSRSYSTTFTQGGAQNAHIILRSLIGFDTHKDKLPRLSKYDSFPLRTSRERRRANKRRAPRMHCVDIGRQAPAISALDHYFPFHRPVSLVKEPVMPEQLVTPGTTTTLLIALDPSLDDILLPLTNLSYRDAEVGLSVMAGLLKGIGAISEAYTLHATQRVIPLLAKLESYGMLQDMGETTPQLWVERARDGMPDVLHVVFPSRSTLDVRKILGESLSQEDWFRLFESVPYTPSESEQMRERWDSTGPSVMEADSVEVDPAESSLSVSSTRQGSYHGTLDDLPHVDSSIYASTTLTPAASQHLLDSLDSLEQSQVEDLVFPRMEIQDSTMSFDLAESTLGASLAWSSESETVDSNGGSIIWSSPPSEVDDDLDSVISDTEWSETSTPISPVDSRPASPTMSWISGNGYGILQPW